MSPRHTSPYLKVIERYRETPQRVLPAAAFLGVPFEPFNFPVTPYSDPLLPGQAEPLLDNCTRAR